MATDRTSATAGALSRVLRDTYPGGGKTDGELLTAFADRQDQAAFAELVRRHGPMVLGVCLRVLRHLQDAEDAFQATFLVLARKAGSVSPPNAVGNWLYGVAHQTAVRARAVTMKRRQRESLAPSVPESAVPEAGWDDLAAVLDEELGRLPDHYRAVVVLCDVEGRTRADAAAHLGCPEGSVSSRLSRAREMLVRRLTKRGVMIGSAALAHLVSQHATAAGLPESLLRVTAEVTGGASLAVTSLAEGVLKAMLMTKLKAATLAAILPLAIGLGGLAGYMAYGQGAGTPATNAAGDGKRAPTPTPKPGGKEDDAKLIQGTWTVVALEQVGRETTKEEKEFFKKGGYKITITADKMIHSPDKSEVKYRLDTTRSPKVLELIADGKVIAKAIYELKGDDLKVCQGRKPDGDEVPQAPDGFDIRKAKPGTFPTLLVMRRVPAK